MLSQPEEEPEQQPENIIMLSHPEQHPEPETIIIPLHTTYTPALKRAQQKYISKPDVRIIINEKNKERMRIIRLTNPEYR
jgi:hypothetical protein